MSDAIYPDLPGIKPEIKRTPMWKTLRQESVSGKVLTASLMTYPSRKYMLAYEFLRAGTEQELQTIEGFFNARQGSFDTFLFNDPDDRAVTDQTFGTGNGATTAFPLLRTRGGFSEPVQSVNGAPVIKVAGVTQATPTNYTISTLGVVNFVVAPLAGAALTWDGAYYWRCRFLLDMLDLDKFLHDLWKLNRIELRVEKQ